ncbi:MAG: hypothetical protein HS100_14975 [Anaerolineales bacterium]|nr:hypothetical protein [Anaerolineales bacterium]
MQQKRFVFLLCSVVLSACSMADLFPSTSTPVPSVTPIITFTPIDTPTSTKTLKPTASATIVRIPTQDPNQPTFTPFALAQILVDGNTITPVATSTREVPGPGFLTVEYAPIKIYWGGCEPNHVNVRAVVEDPDQVFSVIIFVRVRDINKEDYTPWTSGEVMLNRGQGEFTYKLVGSKIYGHNHYLRSWVYFQLVATDIEGEEIGRTRVFEKAFDMYPCPCLTPLTGCPVATPRPTKTPKP